MVPQTPDGEKCREHLTFKILHPRRVSFQVHSEPRPRGWADGNRIQGQGIFQPGVKPPGMIQRVLVVPSAPQPCGRQT